MFLTLLLDPSAVISSPDLHNVSCLPTASSKTKSQKHDLMFSSHCYKLYIATSGNTLTTPIQSKKKFGFSKLWNKSIKNGLPWPLDGAHMGFIGTMWAPCGYACTQPVGLRGIFNSIFDAVFQIKTCNHPMDLKKHNYDKIYNSSNVGYHN